MNLKRLFAVKQPCKDCPFLSECGIELTPGRLDDIKATLLNDDTVPFQCHKTTFSTGGYYSDDNDRYVSSGKESYCAGAMAYLYANGRMNVVMRLGAIMGALNLDELAKSVAVIDISKPQKVGHS
jgi:hypothetical protein